MVDKHNPRDIVFTHPTMGHWKFWQQDQYTPLNASPPASEWSEGGSPRVHEYEEPTKRTLDPVVAALGFLALGGAVGLLVAFPMPTTIHVFIPGAAALSLWVVITWLRVGYALVRHGKATTPRSFRIGLVLASAVVVLGVWQGVVPPAEAEPPPLPDGKYFIAANLFDNEAILPQWSREMVRLVEHCERGEEGLTPVGPENTFVSIYESNSKDATPGLLKRLARELDTRGAGHRIISDETPRRWAYHTSPGRIEFLAKARNRALEPLQSPDAGVRLPDYTQFTKVVFLNDVVWTWQAAVRLLATSLDGEDYDLACAIDLFYAGALWGEYLTPGMYDMWVARDVCGTPMRIFWPYVKDPVSVARLRDDKVFEVSACWNGMVAFPTEPYLYRPPGLASRGWKMVDNGELRGAQAERSDRPGNAVVPRPVPPHPVPVLWSRRVRPLRVLSLLVRPAPVVQLYRAAGADRHEPDCSRRVRGQVVVVEQRPAANPGRQVVEM